MSASLRPRMTLDDFLTWEAQQDARYEFDGAGPVAMTGGTWAHQRIQANLYGHLFQKLRGKRCRYCTSDMKIQVAGRIRYPDAFVACSSYARDATVVDDPIVVFEVLSPSTARIDRIVKLGEYRDTPSIQRYVMLEQDFQAAIVLTRNGNDWVTTAVDADGTLSLPEIEVELPLADLYEGIEMPDDSVG